MFSQCCTRHSLARQEAKAMRSVDITPSHKGTYWDRPFHLVLICSVLICLLLLAGVFAFIGWSFRDQKTQTPALNATRSDDRNMKSPGEQVTNYDLKELGQILWDLDKHKLTNKDDYVLNMQAKTNVHIKADLSPERLFSMVLVDIESISETHSTFIRLLDIYGTERRRTETMTSYKKRKIAAFLEALMNTMVIQEAHRFLFLKGYCRSDIASFKQLLYHVWFEPYPSWPTYNASDSSGFEHVFVGVAGHNSVIGLHNWIRVYRLELEGELNYRGYTETAKPALVSIQFSWRHRRKQKSAMFVGTSPEFDIAIYTICLLVRTNEICPLQIDYFPVNLETWDVSHVTGLQIGAAFPVL